MVKKLKIEKLVPQIMNVLKSGSRILIQMSALKEAANTDIIQNRPSSPVSEEPKTPVRKVAVDEEAPESARKNRSMGKKESNQLFLN